MEKLAFLSCIEPDIQWIRMTIFNASSEDRESTVIKALNYIKGIMDIAPRDKLVFDHLLYVAKVFQSLGFKDDLMEG